MSGWGMPVPELPDADAEPDGPERDSVSCPASIEEIIVVIPEDERPEQYSGNAPSSYTVES